MNRFLTGPASPIAGMAATGVVTLVLTQQVVLPPSPAESKKQSSSSTESDKPGGDNSPPVMDGLSASVDPNTYKIGAEDVIKVLVWKEPDLSFTASVRPDGRVTAPLVGDIVAAGQTPAALAAELKQKNGEFVINPLVNVEALVRIPRRAKFGRCRRLDRTRCRSRCQRGSPDLRHRRP